ncbi:MAG TPA: hypothetical protein VLC09_02125, partial [Polyangiaceae bacterium]|nr:hypothetical protein [Polyangiaceae bacterium]
MKTPRLAVDESRGTWLALILALGYVLAVACCNEYREVFEIDPDESNNLIKALLLEHGASFGGDLWSDQPPLFTYLLAGWFRVVGQSVEHARTFVLGFAGLAVFALVDSARRLGGLLAALGAFVWLVGSSAFVPLSVSVMIGLPSVALLSAACWAALVEGQLLSTSLPGSPSGLPSGSPPASRGRRFAWLALSGALLGASWGVKLFTGFAVVPLVLTVGASALRRSWSAGWRARALELGCAWLIWGLGVVVVFGVVLLPYLGATGDQELIEAHAGLRATRPEWFVGWGSVRGFLVDDAVLFGAALLGVVVTLLRRRWAALSFFGWLLLAGLALALHFPVWPHHRVLVTLPAAALAGLGVGGVLTALLAWIGRRWAGLSRPGGPAAVALGVVA